MRKTDTNHSGGPIAVIGMSGRFPAARNLEELWANLRDAKECISFFSKEDLEQAGLDPAVLGQPGYVNAGGVLAEADLFDAAFFGFNPREAESLDPQQRVFLECAWHAVEDAGYAPEVSEGRVGVFAGCALSSYLLQLYANANFVEQVGYFQMLIGNDKDYLATHVSYKLNLKGPSVTVQTACSTSLVAVCQAAQSLLNRQCDLALAGGVNIRFPQQAGYHYQPEGIYSPDGHCRAFDAGAQGTVFGNGVGVVVLKRLDDALAAGDHIRAVIRGFAVNNDGASKVGYTAPGLEGQAEVIRAAQAMAGVDPGSITYIETHGTGTALGDPIEIEALTQAFRAGTKTNGFCAIGSIKTNVGHLDPAAGIASLIKTVLALEHKAIPPSLHFSKPNPRIAFGRTPFFVTATLTPWKAKKGPRRAGVSAFGIGGTNAHVVLEEFVSPREAANAAEEEHLLLISTKTVSALDAATENLAQHLEKNRAPLLSDVAFTLQNGRSAFPERRACVCKNTPDAVAALRDPRRLATGTAADPPAPVFFLFSGQGTQYPGMAASLYQRQAVFREHFDHCCELFKRRLAIDLRDMVFGRPSGDKKTRRDLNQTAVTQPALFSVEYSLARLLMDWGVEPNAMAGHSIGEYVAACLANVFPLEHAVLLIAERARLMQSLPGGSMLAVMLAAEALRLHLGPELTIAAINTPQLCVASGPSAAIAELQARLENQRVACRLLETSHAFHSQMMEPAMEAFTRVVKTVRMHAPAIPYVSNVTGGWIGPRRLEPTYWSRHLRETVRFSDGLGCLLREPNAILVEIGPGQTLANFARRHPQWSDRHVAVSTLPQRDGDTKSDMEVLLNGLGRLWIAGGRVAWAQLHPEQQHHRVSLPGYPFERQRYWAGASVPSPTRALEPATHAQRLKLDDWFYVPTWKWTPAPKAAPTVAHTWLLFQDDTGLGQEVANLLRAGGHTVVAVTPSPRFAALAADSYSLNPAAAKHFVHLFGALQQAGRMPEHIVHCWNLTARKNGASGMRPFAESQEMGFFSLLKIARAMIARGVVSPLRIDVISRGTQLVTGSESLDPEKATILSPCKCIPQEYPHLHCRSIDVEPSLGDVNTTARQIVGELLSSSSDTVIAYRDQTRWVEAFERRDLPSRPAPLREGAVCLITGGLGNIGLALAEYFARAARLKLCLVGRSPFPPREEWANWIHEKGEDDRTSRRIRKLERIEGLGSEVLVCSADVADEEQMRRVVRQTCTRFGPLQGVIHGAGTIDPADFRGIVESDDELCERHFRPKVHGLRVLEKVTADHKLDFCFLLSSLSSVLGGLGFTAYAAANLYLDAVAQARSRTRSDTRWLAINWDAWHFPPAGTVTPDPPLRAMLPGEGVETFSRILAEPSLNQVVVSVADVGSLIAQWIRSDSLAAADGASKGMPLHQRPNLVKTFVEPGNETERAIAAIWQEVLGFERVGVHDNFFTELNGHSLLATQLVSRLRCLFQIEVPLRRFFEAPTIAELALTVTQLLTARGDGECPERPLVAVAREQRRARVSGQGSLEVPEHLRAELRQTAG
jgi:acyl transferase domain-containing protein/acyl carrier protein